MQIKLGLSPVSCPSPSDGGGGNGIYPYIHFVILPQMHASTYTIFNLFGLFKLYMNIPLYFPFYIID